MRGRREVELVQLNEVTAFVVVAEQPNFHRDGDEVWDRRRREVECQTNGQIGDRADLVCVKWSGQDNRRTFDRPGRRDAATRPF